MEFRVLPLKGIDGIEFGVLPAEVRRHFDTKPKSFMRTPNDSYPCDYFETQGVFFYYDGNGQVEAIEFAPPAQPCIGKLKLLGLGLNEATAALSDLDSEVEKEADGAIAYQLGVSIYAPLAKDNSGADVESVLVFRPGYYD